MRRITRLAWTVSLGAVLLAFGARAQSNPGFTAATPVAPFTATTGGVTATMPAGPAIVVSNTGANAAYCQQGAAASTSSQYIASGSWFEFARINGQTQMTCITVTSTTTINMVGGVGQASGSGGGGSGGGATSNVSIVAPLGSQLKAASISFTLASDQKVPITIDQTTPGTTNGVVTSPGARTLVTLDVKTVTTGGTAVTALTSGHKSAGGWIQNPPSATINLCINEIGTATGTTSSGDTTCITPGSAYKLVASAGAVSVVSSDSAHPFSGQGWQ